MKTFDVRAGVTGGRNVDQLGQWSAGLGDDLPKIEAHVLANRLGKHVPAMPINLGEYWRMTLANPSRRFATPPKMAVASLKFDDAMSNGSLKWLIM